MEFRFESLAGTYIFTYDNGVTFKVDRIKPDRGNVYGEITITDRARF